MYKTIIVLSLALLAQAGHGHYDPFAGSGCDCDRFCKNECSINATEPANLTFYRMTMEGVLDLSDKDTGDIKGDTGFVLSRRETAYKCRKNPDSFMCKDIAQFSGDDKNSTDLVLEMQVEVDGQWGIYLECNPLNASDSQGPWNCTNGLSPKIPNYPATCTKCNYHAFEGWCIKDTIEPDFVANATLGACCELASFHASGHYMYNFTSQTCKLYKSGDLPGGDCKKNDTLMGYYEKPEGKPCECDRVY